MCLVCVSSQCQYVHKLVLLTKAFYLPCSPGFIFLFFYVCIGRDIYTYSYLTIVLLFCDILGTFSSSFEREALEIMPVLLVNTMVIAHLISLTTSHQFLGKSGSPLHCGFVYAITDWCHFLLCGSTITTWLSVNRCTVQSLFLLLKAPLFGNVHSFHY